MIRLIIADDHTVVCKGLKQIFDETPDIKVTNEAATGTQLLEIVEKQEFDVVLLDISMPGRDGLDILRVLRPDKPNLMLCVF